MPSIRSCKIELLLVRHCTSLFNTGEDITSPDVGLSDDGKKHACTLTGCQDASLVICSPLKRCRDTLKLSKLALKARAENNIIYSSLCREHKTDICDFFEGEPILIETEEDILNRIEKFKEWLLQLWHTKYINVEQKQPIKFMVVTHADFCFYLTGKKVKTSEEDGEGELFGKWLKNGEILSWTITLNI